MTYLLKSLAFGFQPSSTLHAVFGNNLYTKIVVINSYTLDTKKNFLLLFDNILPVFESFQVKPKIAIF